MALRFEKGKNKLNCYITNNIWHKTVALAPGLPSLNWDIWSPYSCHLCLLHLDPYRSVTGLFPCQSEQKQEEKLWRQFPSLVRHEHPA